MTSSPAQRTGVKLRAPEVRRRRTDKLVSFNALLGSPFRAGSSLLWVLGLLVVWERQQLWAPDGSEVSEKVLCTTALWDQREATASGEAVPVVAHHGREKRAGGTRWRQARKDARDRRRPSKLGAAAWHGSRSRWRAGGRVETTLATYVR